ncbi:hypothetical protein [Williamsia sp.]
MVGISLSDQLLRTVVPASAAHATAAWYCVPVSAPGVARHNCATGED